MFVCESTTHSPFVLIRVHSWAAPRSGIHTRSRTNAATAMATVTV
jgi:hypothetical protein